MEEAEEIRQTDEWKEIYPLRKESIERVFADCKECFGIRFTRLKGLKKSASIADDFRMPQFKKNVIMELAMNSKCFFF